MRRLDQKYSMLPLCCKSKIKCRSDIQFESDNEKLTVPLFPIGHQPMHQVKQETGTTQLKIDYVSPKHQTTNK